MARIRSRGNRDTELRLIALMREHGITGWRRQRTLRMSESGCRKGKAFAVNVDFVFPKQRVAVFVDGCFWHGCPRHATMPATRAAWWAAKLARNLYARPVGDAHFAEGRLAGGANMGMCPDPEKPAAGGGAIEAGLGAINKGGAAWCGADVISFANSSPTATRKPDPLFHPHPFCTLR